MKCKICGGNLILQDNVYVCHSCHNKFSLSAVYENTDVFIAYIENDNLGRRTKDSIVSQDIYNKLQTAKIQTFYERISCANEAGESLKQTCDFALSNSKIIIIVGTSKESFEKIINDKSFGEGKIILPVYADMEAYDLPNNFKNLQALNYNTLGAVNDLIKIILHALNRDNEYNVVDVSAESEKKRKNITIASICGVAVILISCILYYVFGTTNILPSKKYEAAMQDLNNDNYVEAVKGFSEILSYKDSADQLKTIYNKYIGYYHNDEHNISLHLEITDNIKTLVEIKKLTENGDLVIKESSEIKENLVAFGYNDSENNQGNVELILQNKDIIIKIKTDTTTGNSSYGNVDLSFKLDEKSDKPLTKSVDAATLKKWMSKRYTLNDIRKEGFELIFDNGNSATTWNCYNIANTDVYVNSFDKEFPALSEPLKDGLKDVVFAYVAPAEIVIPNKVGIKSGPFISNNIMYFPHGGVGCVPPVWLEFWHSDKDVIENDTPIACLSKALISEESWQDFVKEYIYSYHLTNIHHQLYGGDGTEYFDYFAENDTDYLATISYGFDVSTTPIYKINKSTYNVEFVAEIPYENINSNKVIYIQDYPEYFSDFIN